MAGDGVRVLDLTPAICPEGTCLPVVGNVYVFLDDNHLTGAYATSPVPHRREQLTAFMR